MEQQMYIKEIVIDGFKSYGKRVEVKGLDPYFNAITGVNGSGKSNILDAICFVLGITNLANVRANTLADLIYKGSNVNQASVTITFHKSNGENIVICKQLIRTNSGQIKTSHLMNGLTANPKKINKFFQTMHLNINNPNFLVMQGKMTKVLNMKPLEILSLLEETAGTSILEVRREEAKKKITKKEEKLKKIEESLDELMPNIQRFKQCLENFRIFKEVEKEHDDISKVHKVYTYRKIKRSLEELVSIKNEHQAMVCSKNEEKDDLERAIDGITKQLDVLQKKKDKEFGGNLNKYTDHLRKKEREKSKLTVEINGTTSEISLGTEDIVTLEWKITKERESISAAEEIIIKINEEIEKMDIQNERDTQDLSVANKICGGNYAAGKLESETAISVKKSDETEKLTKAERDLCDRKYQLNNKKEELDANNLKFQKLKKFIDLNFIQLNRSKEKVSQLKDELLEFGVQDTTYRAINEYQLNEKREINQLEGNIANNKKKYSRIYFDYTMPNNPEFDKSRVRGTVCTLFKCKDEKFRPALEIASEGHLMSVVVDTSDVSRELITKGKYTNRTTFVPLDKMTTKPMRVETLKAAQRLVGDKNVFWALELIEYEPQYKKVMDFVFGNIFICKDNKIAEAVTYNPSIHKASVTLNGFKYSPDGVGHGGTGSKARSWLEVVEEVDNMQKEMECKIKNLQKFDEIYARLQAEERQLVLADQNIENSGYRSIERNIKELPDEISKLEACCRDYENSIKRINENIKKINEKLNNKNKSEADVIKEAIEKKEVLEKAISNRETNREKLKEELHKSEVDLIASKETVSNYLSSLAEAKQKIETGRKLLDDLQKQLVPINAEVKLIKDKIEEEKTRMREEDNQISDLTQGKEDIQTKINDITKQLLIANGEREKYAKDIQTHEKELMKNKYDSIRSLGDEVVYNFENFNEREIVERINELERRKRELQEAGISTKTDCHIDSEKVESLINKKQKVTDDKTKLLHTIDILKEKKRIAIEKAYESVNKDFGSIYGTLLQGANAKLVKVSEDISKGLKIMVSFNDVWKDGLLELSGGQRSLVGLSLILAMLKYKPAPIYILDEVDAALDLSHTQNIGRMIKKHFKQSQFIIVSLKEGMFNNANILFRTKLVNEVSTVTRLTNVRDNK